MKENDQIFYEHTVLEDVTGWGYPNVYIISHLKPGNFTTIVSRKVLKLKYIKLFPQVNMYNKQDLKIIFIWI